MNNNSVTTVLFVGVGGQGIIMASDLLSRVMLRAGRDVKKSEVHGMAQRGGCVSSHVRYGGRVYSPLAGKGGVDILVSFETMETLRYLDYLKKGGSAIVNDEELFPPAVNLGDEAYPADVPALLKKTLSAVKILKATDMALQAGDRRMANTVMLGALSSFTDVNEHLWKDVLRASFPERLVEKNLTAFNMGRTY
ncbi:MAG: indolepyruvate oxidoreductase subunit beta [Syntrophales bacterium]|jgi:indolepyruvate ferredoxin oxidoreductase beta subunit|nr:indolepyruvate oxidoreductase subunit beta [Syntrophales bacterium]MCK9527247.1 indolepyruvate oxidoreductase subunit beta [Syntrophales bacterium]MDX9921283.1 indolepyruvate oxidoreductase subunit beta [Syntrophales bacterium]